MANPLEQVLNRVKQILTPASNAMSVARMQAQNLGPSAVQRQNAMSIGRATLDAPKAFAQTFYNNTAPLGSALGYGLREAVYKPFGIADSQLYARQNQTNINASRLAKTPQAKQRLLNEVPQMMRVDAQKAQDLRNAAPGSAAKTALTLIGAGEPGQMLAGAGVGGGLNAALAGFQGQNPLQAFGEGAAQALPYAGVNRLTSPFWNAVTNDIVGNSTSALGRRLVSGTVMAGGNVAENSITTPLLEGRMPTLSENLIAGGAGFGFGAAIPVKGKSRLGGNRSKPPMTVKRQLEVLSEQPRKMGKYSSTDMSTAANVVLGKRNYPKDPTPGFLELFSQMNKSLSEEQNGVLVPKADPTKGMTRTKLDGFIDLSAKVGGEAPAIDPQVKVSSGGNIYIKTGKNEVIKGIPKTVQNDLNSLVNGEVVNPDRMLKTKEYLRRSGIDLVRNEDTFKYELKAISTPLEALQTEARKYKSAEEFIKAVTNRAESVAQKVDPNYDYASNVSATDGYKAYQRETGGLDATKLANLYTQATAPKVETPNLTQQLAETVTGKKLRVRPSPTVEAPPIKPLTEPEVVKSNNRAKEAGVPSREEVKASLPQRLDSFIQDTLGYTTEAPTGGTRQANLYTRSLRSGQAKLTSAVEKGLGAENPLIRNAASTMQNFFRGLGMSPERAAQSAELRGGLATSVQRGSDVAESLYASLGKDPKVIASSRTRINAVLDPKISKIKVKLSDLTPEELAVHNLIRKGLDYVHDVNYANGFIGEQTYRKNLGTYTPRKYITFEMPEEINQFAQQRKKIDLSSSKARKALDDWKINNSINDPVYALGTALTQTETNATIKRYTDFLASQPNLIADVERPGFTKLSDSKAYGALSGKYVLNSAAEDLKGFFYANEALQKTYDVFRAWDRLPPRQIQKKLLTVFNPTTNVGNIISDQIFGWGSGVDPLTLNANLFNVKKNPELYKQLSDYLMRKGIVGTDITRTDIVSKFSSIDSVARSVEQPQSKLKTLKTIGNKVQSFYGGTDDAYKVAALKSLLDKGFSLEEATRKVADGFQNYASVGKFYDTWAKTPIIGSPFIKFQGDLIRIIKNTAVNNPLGLISFLGALQAVSVLSSKASGETPEDYKTRTERFAAPMIPGLNIPLTWQTPIGEINAARYVSPFYANNETTNVAKMIPFAPNINTKKDVATNIAMNVNDPLVSPLVQTLVNRDFRGKPISDPNETKWSPSTLTDQEKLANQAKFVARAYTPPPVNSAIDVGSALQGKENMYGATQTPGQALARLGGVKISQFGPEQAQAQRTNDAYYDQKQSESNLTTEKTIAKDLLSGKIDQKTADARIANIYKDSGSTANPLSNGITQLEDGTYATMIGKQLKSFDTPEEATLAVDKQKFKESDKNVDVIGDTVFRRSKDGNVTTMPKIDYDTLMTTQKMENAKLNDDYKTWMDLALVQAGNIQTQMQDPTLDDLEKGDLQQKLDALIDSAVKYQGQGGFKKPKKAKAAPKMQVAKFAKPSFKMKRGTTKKSTIKTVASKKIAPPKIKVSRFKVKKA